MKPKYLDQIFPKGITAAIYDDHLRVYSKTLVSYITEIQELVPIEYHQLLPYRLYLCPLCLKSHFIKTNFGVVGNCEFSLDHLPPKNAGGTYKLITCKKCNNDSGTFESELERLLNFAVDKTTPGATKPLKVKVINSKTGSFIQGLAHHKNGITDIRFDEKLKKFRKDYADFLEGVHSGKSKELQLQVPLFDPKKIERALVKSAYLLCFVWWGYEFVFSENGTFMREVIAGTKDYPCQVPVNWLEKEARQPTGIALMQDGNDRIAFLVSINLKGIEVQTTATILIPGATMDGWMKLSRINDMMKSGQVKGYKCTSLPRIVDRIGYTVSWNIVIPPPGNNPI